MPRRHVVAAHGPGPGVVAGLGLVVARRRLAPGMGLHEAPEEVLGRRDVAAVERAFEDDVAVLGHVVVGRGVADVEARRRRVVEAADAEARVPPGDGLARARVAELRPVGTRRLADGLVVAERGVVGRPRRGGPDGDVVDGLVGEHLADERRLVERRPAGAALDDAVERHAARHHVLLAPAHLLDGEGHAEEAHAALEPLVEVDAPEHALLALEAAQDDAHNIIFQASAGLLFYLTSP